MPTGKLKYTICILVFWLLFRETNAQCVLPVITAPQDACIDQELVFEVESDEAEVTWDFCSGELGEVPVPEIILDNSRSFGRSRGIKVIGDPSNGYYLFSVNNAIDELTILGFGSSLFNSPTIIQQINISAHSPDAFDVEVVSHGDGHSVFIASSQSNTVTRLDFLSSLFDEPEVSVLNIPFEQQVNAITIEQEGQRYVGFVSQDNRITRLDFGGDIMSVPNAQSFDIPGGGTLRKIALLKYCDTWLGLILSYNSTEVWRLDLDGGSLMGNISASPLSNNGSNLRFPSNISMNWEGDHFYIHVSGALGNVYFAKIEATDNITALDITDYGTLGLSSLGFPLSVNRDGPYWVGFTADLSARDLVRHRFPSDCDEDQQLLTGTKVMNSYSSSGVKPISVEIRQNDTVQKKGISVAVSDNIAPPASFSFLSGCLSNPVFFNLDQPDGGIATVTWQFGDGTTATGTSVQHIYTEAGPYTVLVDVVGTNGCANASQQDIVVYPDFTAGFMPGADKVCTNTTATLINGIDPELRDVTSHEWYVEGELVSTQVDLEYEFQASGTYQVELITRLNDCSSSFTDQVEVLEGPKPSFIVSDACVGTDLEFSNTTTGSVSSYLWDFGDGTTSTATDPVYTYSEPGDYLVRLEAFNAAGCLSVFEQLVTVYAQPSPSFSTELACAGNPVVFIDESVVQNANIESWLWDFGNGNTSNERDPEYAFPAEGVYPVSLTVTSTFGCEATVTQDVEVLPSPLADFSFTTACIGETVFFTDTSIPPSGETITSWAWNIGGAFSSQRNPSYTFEFATDYKVSLFVVASNQCIGTVEQTVSVPVAPQVDFEVFGNCVENDALFTDITSSPDDPITARTWDFGGLGIAEGQEASFRFPRTGVYTVTLTVETEQGCTYSTSRQVDVGEPPVAGFDASALAGPPPLDVDFTNTSLGAGDFEWSIDGVVVSNNRDFSFVFEELGTYDVELRAFNDEGCVDVFSRVVSAVVPEVDLSADDLLGIRSNGILSLQMRVRNLGTIPVTRIPLKLLLEDGIIVNGTVDVNLEPGAAGIYRLPFELEDREFSFLCVEIGDEISGFPDIDLSNNSACTTFGRDGVISKPYPNPANEEIQFQIYGEDAGEATVEIINSAGQLVAAPAVRTDRGGITTVTIDTSTLRQGVYILRIRSAEAETAHRITVRR